MPHPLDYLTEFCTVRQLEVLEAYQQHGSGNKAAKALGVGRRYVDKVLEAIKTKAAKARVSAHADPEKIPVGFGITGTTTLRKNGEEVMQWVKTSEDKAAQELIRQAALDALAATLPREKPVKQSGEVKEDLCNLYTFTDFHLGMLAWHKEGGADWDLKIAERVLWECFQRMVDAAPPAGTAVLNIQGDFLHSDGLLPVTPTSKHVLDQDGRFSKIVDVAIRTLRRLVRYALTKHQMLHIIIVEGNHDEASSLWLRKLFAALYEDEPRVTVNESELPFYVYQHGGTMLAFHHGHKVKNEQLPGLFAAQFPRMWGDTERRYCHTGHRHHVDEKEYNGMIVTQHPTLSARDAYAARGGWIADRAAMAITYHRRKGQCGRTYVTPDEE